ncbi:hypothetical protein [Flavobacterium sp.]|uniref:hypothetical protein n=1 Tax=Flavobacterium sp. TaxID=239 RepID=UPI003C3B1F5F
MKKNTLENYKREIQAKYEIAIQEEFSCLLATPAVMRDLCLSLINEGLTANDEIIFRQFFDLNKTEDLLKGIINCNISLFKPIRSFLKGEKNTDALMRIELAAILVNFKPRPFGKYTKISSGIGEEAENNELLLNKCSDKLGENENQMGIIKKPWIPLGDNKSSVNIVAWFLGTGMLLLVLGCLIKMSWFPEKQCMEWLGNHYEEVDCHNEKLGIGALRLIVPINDNAIQLRKLDCKQKIIFFKNEKPLVWYCKFEGVVELYDRSGFHPITGKPLKPITTYMINKYNLVK